MEAAAIEVMDDERDLYPIHEEDSLPQNPDHHEMIRYLVEALQARFPQYWFTADMCHYWEPNNPKGPYVAPDLSVIGAPPPDPFHSVYLTWRDPPLRLVLEIGSRSTFGNDTGPKVETYEKLLKAPEYIYAYSRPHRLELRMWRMGPQGYDPVLPDSEGRVWSEQLGVGFGFDENRFLRIFTSEGNQLQTYGEIYQGLEETSLRVEREAQQRVEAERRASEEARRREEAERELMVLRAELERLRWPPSDETN